MLEIVEFVQKAIQFEEQQCNDAAIYFYGEAASLILQAIKDGKLPVDNSAKAEQYISRAEDLKIAQNVANLSCTEKETEQLQLERAHFLLSQGLDEDEQENYEEAIELYMEAVQLCLQARKSSKSKDLQQRLASVAKDALERAEHLKGNDVEVEQSLAVTQGRNSNINFLACEPGDVTGSKGSVSPNTERKSSVNADRYSDDELAVLKATSLINGREYVPFMSFDVRERFAYPVPFTDKDGMLALADKQKQKSARWVRPQDFVDEPILFDRVDFSSIKQTVISDCSFIASLAIAAQYEKRYQRKLISTIVYPQNKRGEPVFNPCGKYMVKLHLNGVQRKIIIDDFLPMGKHGELLCSFSNKRREMWVSLLEKAYMKVMGGYDFPGSNSNIDLHALTGWIPERIAIRPNEPTFNGNETFNKLFQRFHQGDCLATLATGALSKDDQDRSGLVDCHAYAMIDIRQVEGQKLLLLKNPWNHLRWKGKYSERDLTSWTPEMQSALNYDPKSAQQFDDGVFWIDYDSVCKFYDVIYINWNPSLFKHTSCVHAGWNAGLGPAKDLYNMGDNPQYFLELNNNKASAAVWILLTRHITDKDDFANNREYIAVLVYKNDGEKVFYPFDPPPYIDGVRINSPHYLCKMVLTEPGVQRYTLAVSQYEKSHTIQYTLRCYSTVPFKLKKISKLKYNTKAMGEWKGASAGGCHNYRDTYKNNPILQITLDGGSHLISDFDLCILLKGPKPYSVGFDFVQVKSDSNRPFTRQDTGSFRTGFCALNLNSVPSGVYNIIPTTFLQNQEGPFILEVQSSCPVKINSLQ